MTSATPTRGTPARELFGAVEAGGSKFRCAIGTRDGSIVHHVHLETRDPASTLAEVCRYFKDAARDYAPVVAMGLGAFGPLDLNPDSPTYGHITTTPKPGWSGTDLVGTLRHVLDCPIRLDTDVNAAALSEARWGAGRGLDSLAYVTVGSGIGVGILHQGRPLHGLTHLEVGHTFVRRHPADPVFAGACPYHADCLEGLASGKAIHTRTGHDLEELAAGDSMWEIEADYLGQLCAMLVLTHSPHRIVVGGGVLHQRLYPKIREQMLRWLHGYVAAKEIFDEGYVVPPALGDDSGIKGALALAIEARAEPA